MSSSGRIRGGIGADGPFWAALEHEEFRVPRCSKCKSWMWPAHFRCGHCGSWTIDWVEIEPIGTLYTWTRNHAVSDVIKERREMLPYVTILVELTHAGGIRIPGVLAGSDAGLHIGAPLRGRIRPADELSKNYVTMIWGLEALE